MTKLCYQVVIFVYWNYRKAGFLRTRIKILKFFQHALSLWRNIWLGFGKNFTDIKQIVDISGILYRVHILKYWQKYGKISVLQTLFLFIISGFNPFILHGLPCRTILLCRSIRFVARYTVPHDFTVPFSSFCSLICYAACLICGLFCCAARSFVVSLSHLFFSERFFCGAVPRLFSVSFKRTRGSIRQRVFVGGCTPCAGAKLPGR